jgi:DNA mismatch endonuclease, patch repair protein
MPVGRLDRSQLLAGFAWPSAKGRLNSGGEIAMPSERHQRAAWPGVPQARRKVMQANRRRDTTPELQLRSALHRGGLRFRVDFPIRLAGKRLLRPDVVFPRQRVVVYVDGCWWHGCPEHWTRSRTNASYWAEKVEANRARDRRDTATLEQHGWRVLRFWEHEDVTRAAAAVSAVVHGAT